jgi:hypothetical protein
MHFINRNKPFVIITAVSLIMLIAAATLWLRTKNTDVVNRGPVWEAVEKSLGSYADSNPVKEDLIRRGLVSIETQSGYIDAGKIEELVDEKVYMIDEDGNLQFGPSYFPP